MRVDSATTRYAVDFNDIGPIGERRLARPALLRDAARRTARDRVDREHRAAVRIRAWSARSRGRTPPTHRAPVNPRTLAALDADRRRIARQLLHAERRPCSRRASVPRPLHRAVSPTRRRARFCRCSPTTLPAARAVHASGTTVVRVDLDETSTVVGAGVVRSSGYAPLDRAALAAAQKSSYRTESFACRPVASTYQFTVTFGGG